MTCPSSFRLLIAVLVVASMLVGCASGKPSSNGGTPSGGPTGGSSSPGQGGNGGPATVSDLPRCKLPPEVPFPEWVPKDLPLPKGTYAYERLPREYGYYRGLFVVPLLTSQFGRYVLRNWPKAGFQLGRGDQEPGEVEGQFVRPPAFGAFKARDLICREPNAFLLLLWTPDQSNVPEPATQPSPLPGQSPPPGATPLVSPSPSVSPSPF